MNPWTSIWLHPRQTIRQIVDSDPKRLVLLLAMSGGLADLLIGAVDAAMAREVFPLKAILIFCLIAGPLMGLMGLYVMGWLYRWVGSWMGGKANTVQIRAAIGWSHVPALWLLGFWVILVVVSGGEILKPEPEMGSSNLFFALLLLLFGLGMLVLSIWRVILLIQMLAEVHQFSARRAIWTLSIPYLAVLLLPISIILAAIAIPNLLKARHNANEAAAIKQLQTLSKSLELYRRGQILRVYPEKLSDLSESAPPYAPPSLTGEVRYGYTLTYTRANPSSYTLTATPRERGATGTRSFFVDESGIIRVSESEAASAASPPLLEAP